MTMQRMDNVLIVVEDLEAAMAFFGEPAWGWKARPRSRGRGWPSVVSLDGVRADIAVRRTPTAGSS